MSKKVPQKITQFLGLNQAESGETELKLGESSYMKNFRITNEFNLQKRNGFSVLSSYAKELYKMIESIELTINGTLYFVYALSNGDEVEIMNNTTLIGTIDISTSSEYCHMFEFSNKLYILIADEYYVWTGTGSVALVAGYVPLLYVATPPAGGGTAYDEINLLTGKAHVQFNGNNSATAFVLPETSIDSVDSVYVGGVLKTVTTHYTVVTATGTVTFTSGNTPATGVNNVDIYYTNDRSTRDDVTKYRFSNMYGGKNDTRIFLYGDGSHRYVYTGLAGGVPSAEYFPANAYREVGSANRPVTGIIRQYDRQLIFKQGGEAYYSYYDAITDVDGNVIPSFPTFPLNYTKGNTPYGQPVLILNDPVTIQDDVYRWKPSDVQDERNAVPIGGRVRTTLDTFTMADVLMFDYEKQRELWIADGKVVIVYNYYNDTWYVYEFTNDICHIGTKDNLLVLAFTNGDILVDDSEAFNDKGAAFSAVWEMGYYGWDVEWLRKYISKSWIALKPEAKSSLDVTWETDRTSEPITLSIEFNNIDYGNVDYGDWTYDSSYNPKPKRIRTKAKKWTYFKLLLKNDTIDTGATVLSIVMNASVGGESK